MKTNGYFVNFNKNEDEFISVNTFKSAKRIASNVLELRSFYVDLDFYNSPYLKKNSMKIESFLDNYPIEKQFNRQHKLVQTLVFSICYKHKLSRPTIIYSGNGYHLKWDILPFNYGYYGASAIQSNAYLYCESSLVSLFKELGADSHAKDISRVLRKENSINSKTGYLCHMIYESNHINSFKTLAESVLPFTYKEVVEYKATKPTKEQVKICNKFNLPVADTKVETRKLLAKFFNENKKGYKQSTKYISNILDNCLTNKFIKEGNRAYYFFYFAIGQKRQGKSLEEIIILAEDINTSYNLEFPHDQLVGCIESGFNSKSTNIKKKTLYKAFDLNAYKIKKVDNNKRTQKRRTKKEIVKASNRLMNNFNKHKKLSVRKLGIKYKISKTKAAELKKLVEEYLKTLNDKKSIEGIEELQIFVAYLITGMYNCNKNTT